MAVDASILVSPDAAYRALRSGVASLRRWVRVLLAIRLATWGIIVAAGAAALVVLFGKLQGVLYPVSLPAGVLAEVAAGATIIALFWPLSSQVVSMSADTRLRLWDRLSTAMELSRRERPTGMERAQVMDAVLRLGGLRLRRAYPVRTDRATKVMLGCVAALLAVQFLPIPPLLLSQREREEKAELRRQAARLEPVARKLEAEAKHKEDEEAQKVAQRLRKLARDLRLGRLDKKRALLELAELEKRLKALEDNIKPPSLKTAGRAAEQIKQQGRDNLAERARKLAERAADQGEQQLRRELEKLAKKAAAAKKTSELEEVARQLAERAAKLGTHLPLDAGAAALSLAIGSEDWDAVLGQWAALQAALENPGRKLSEEELRELAKQLEELAKRLKDTDLKHLAECLKKAGKCLRQGDCRGAGACLGAGRAGSGLEGIGAVRLRTAARAAGECAGACAGACRGRRAGSGAGEGMGVGPDQGSRQGIPPGTPGASLYAPRRTDVDTTPERVRSHVRPGGEMYATPTRGAPDRVSDSRVPYYEVIGDYSRAAEEALEGEQVPPAYRPTVRRYFESLQSGEEPSGGNESDDSDGST